MSALYNKTLACMLLACIGASWFAYQYVLYPQETRYDPDWHEAQWVESADGYAPVAYFRRVIDLAEMPDAAFITVAASQVFSLYVNGALVGSNAADFSQDDVQRASMFDIVSLLHQGTNSIALRVKNLDKQTPLLRASLVVVRGKATSYDGSSENWIATTQSSNVYHRYSVSMRAWTTAGFVAASWPAARQSNHPAPSPLLTTNPQLYEQPVATHWLSAGAGQEAYFFKEIAQPFFVQKTWLRLAVVGTASVFVNGRLYIVWNGQATVREQYLSDYLSDDDAPPIYRNGLAVGIYDISAYLHSGINSIAVHSVAPAASAAQIGLASLRAAISLDILTSDADGHITWLHDDAGWRTATHANNQWAAGAIYGWPPATIVSRPGASNIFYVPASSTPRNTQLTPFSLIVGIVLVCITTIAALCLLLARVLRPFYQTFGSALAATSLAFFPALACEALLVVLFREPQMSPAFSYTLPWGLLLVGLFIACYVAIWLYARMAWIYQLNPFSDAQNKKITLPPLTGHLHRKHDTTSKHAEPPETPEPPSTSLRTSFLPKQILYWLLHYWMLLLLMSVAALLVCYDITYEPLWQDELSSYYAAHGILMHGLPLFPSGFLYEKAELYSYLLAAWNLLFGEQGSAARLISALEYVLIIPLMYRVGNYFFRRSISLLATAMLAFSPLSLIWARQVRMYEQEQLLTLLVVYLFFRAAHEQGRKRIFLTYIAMASLVIDYLTHEEMFIVLPGLVVCVVLASRDKRYLLPSVLREKHWWYAALAAAAILVLQWTLTRVTHPPFLGSDSSQRPFIQLTTDNVAYYINLLFFPSSLPQNTILWMPMNSLLATAGCFLAQRSSNPRAKYCALFLLLSCLTLLLLFTMRADRYFYVLLPVYYLMGAYAVATILRSIWSSTNQRLYGPLAPYRVGPTALCLSRQLPLWRTISLTMLCAAILLEPALPLSNYNLFVSRIMGFSYHRHYPDYDVAGAYLQRHWRRGDTVVSVVPDFCTYYYAGHVDYFFSIDRALFLLERNGHIIDTSVGALALLNQGDFNTVLAAHRRVWIISDNGAYQAQVAKRFTFPADFHIVYEGYATAIYFRDD